ncbi:putative glycosyltransferase 6 domain-containing protein 1 [Elephas maximus indicus]|uniref:putative glycosyltransferase 6 domain-containing protein 1 n=1 Tax=Elephas maximus indicus TaxID=99487 RepID=UPI002116BC98|nr:putative glycosyltransferase 6 domain-containing protein 1 [Elephas maximus indicus]
MGIADGPELDRQHAALSRAREAGTLTVDVGPKPVRPLWKATSMFSELTVDPAVVFLGLSPAVRFDVCWGSSSEDCCCGVSCDHSGHVSSVRQLLWLLVTELDRMRSNRKMLLLVSFLFSLLLVERYFRNHQVKEIQLSDWFNPSKRPDVVTMTDWHAPVIWEGTFNRRVLNNYYQRRNITVGLAVFAVGRFVDEYLELFIRSADKHFMVGYKVIFYVIVDALFQLPDLKLGPLRTFKAFKINEEDLWYDLNLLRMKSLGDHIIWHIQNEADFLFSMAVNQVFQNDFGVETLGKSVAQLHRWWYFKNTKNFPYERRPGSAACIPFGLGDFYYDSSIIGGTPQEILNLIDKYLKGVVHDTSNRLNSTYESHLNKYFFLNKPTKLLSPEYNWDPKFRLPPQIEYVKVVWRSERD